ncbi:hypothetical protein LTR53_008750 [Teratosphaeriaceae sp. CCFEE 6253]|nr:hypothetical protein LTR53_008750 [Teratosphaeriaceae sp. CCFEE 6253]
MPWAPVEYPVAAGLMKAALEQGANFWDGYPEDTDKVVLSIKGALGTAGPTGSPKAIRASVDEAVKVLGGIKTIDVFEMARVDPNVPIETSIRALADLVQEGKIKGIGLSEVSATTIRRAHAVHLVAAVEVELSLFTPDPLRNGIARTCRELGIPMIAYSPIGRGQISSELRKLDDLPKDDFRRMKPRFSAEAFEQNFRIVQAVEKLAGRKGVSTAQVAIAWAVRQGAIPIPGSTKLERVSLNSRAVALTDQDMAELQGIMECHPVAGERYGGAHEALLNA